MDNVMSFIGAGIVLAPMAILAVAVLFAIAQVLFDFVVRIVKGEYHNE
nr:MAG TPA: hypothetical protein [Caudoviricetes sp.]